LVLHEKKMNFSEELFLLIIFSAILKLIYFYYG
jgi:hypothetical protein